MATKFRKYYPYLLGFLFFLLLTPIQKTTQSIIVEETNSNVVQLISILVGFTIGSISLVLASPRVHGLNWLRARPKQFRQFTSLHLQTIVVGIVAAIITIMLPLQYRLLQIYTPFLFAIWGGVVAASLLLFIKTASALCAALLFVLPTEKARLDAIERDNQAAVA